MILNVLAKEEPCHLMWRSNCKVIFVQKNFFCIGQKIRASQCSTMHNIKYMVRLFTITIFTINNLNAFLYFILQLILVDSNN